MDFCYDQNMMMALWGTILFVLAWCYWYVTKPYANFPTYWAIADYIKMRMSGKIPGGILSTDVIFQVHVDVSERFRREGMYLTWVPFPLLLVFSEKAVKACFSGASDDKPDLYRFTHDIFGAEGLITSKAEIWKKHRKMLNPLFHTHALKDNITAFNNCAKALVKELSEIEDKSSVDIQKNLKRCSINAVWKSILRLQSYDQEKMGPAEEIGENVEKLAEISMHRAMVPWLRPEYIFSRLKSGKEYRKCLNYWNDFTRKVLLDLSQSFGTSQEAEFESPDIPLNSKSFAEILIDHQHRDKSFTPENVQDQVKTFASAGTGTIALSMTWCLYLLGLHPDIQEKVYNEVVSVTDGFITFEQICKLKYLDSVIMEVLRLYPVVPFVGRTLKSDVQFENYKIPKGTDIAFHIYALHRNSEVFPDPEKFDPDRFLDGSIVKRPFAYMPFSEGSRNCIGKKFAMMEAKVVLAHIIRNFKVTSVTKREDFKLRWLVELQPTQPILIKITPRN